jgi:hypothetical protein
MGVPGDRDGGCCLKKMCMNAGVKVIGAVGQEKEREVHININRVDGEVVSRATGCHKV